MKNQSTNPSNYINKNLRLSDGRRANFSTEKACRQAIELFTLQIRKIERQMQAGVPFAFQDDPEGAAHWKVRAEAAIDFKRESIIQIEAGLELAREARIRQLADIRIRREADARKRARVREANSHPDVSVRYFRNEVRRRLPETEYEDIWTAAKATMASEGVSS